jgi:hypothetical protein
MIFSKLLQAALAFAILLLNFLQEVNWLERFPSLVAAITMVLSGILLVVALVEHNRAKPK